MRCNKCGSDVVSDESIAHGILRCVNDKCNALYTIAYGPLRLEESHAHVLCPLPGVQVQPGSFSIAFRNSWGEDWGKNVAPSPYRNFNYETTFFCSPGKPLGEYDDCVPEEIKAEAEKKRVKAIEDGTLDPNKKLSNLHQWSDGITPYMKCPWCGYTDVSGEFLPYTHPYDLAQDQCRKGSTECGQCMAAGPTAMFILAYNKEAKLYDCEQYRDLYLGYLNSTPQGDD